MVVSAIFLILQFHVMEPIHPSSSSISREEHRAVPSEHTSAQVEERDYGGLIPRVFLPWPSDLPLPCVPPEDDWKKIPVQQSKATQGFLFVRLAKTASSTVSGVLLRLARNVARSRNIQPICKVRVYHSTPLQMDYNIRDTNSSVLISFLREPTKRMASHFFFNQVSR